MKKVSGLFRLVINLLMICLVAAGIYVLVRFAVSAVPKPVSMQGESQAYPPPATDIPFVPYTPALPSVINPTPFIETPPPTFTPYPSPTQSNEPTPTPIPPVTPAGDAEGEILFAEKANDTEVAIYRVPVDKKGEKKDKEKKAKDKQIVNSLVYYSPNGKLAAIQGAYGIQTIIDLETGEELAVNEAWRTGRILNWFPDSVQILMRSGDENLLLANTMTGTFILLAVPGYGMTYGGAASPDGRQVIYSYQRSYASKTEIWVVSSNGRDARKLLERDLYNSSFSWSPDGQKVVFYEGGWMVMNPDGSDLRRIGQHGVAAGYDLPPAWSPDSSKIAYVSSEDPNAFTDFWNKGKWDRSTQIFILDVTTGEEREVLPGDERAHLDPAWSPDGKLLTFAACHGKTCELWSVDPDGLNPRQIADPGVSIRFVFWRKN